MLTFYVYSVVSINETTFLNEVIRFLVSNFFVCKQNLKIIRLSKIGSWIVHSNFKKSRAHFFSKNFQLASDTIGFSKVIKSMQCLATGVPRHRACNGMENGMKWKENFSMEFGIVKV